METLGKPKKETKRMSREQWLREILKDIDPAKYAGEGWYATEEYAGPMGIDSPYTRAEIGMEGDYYPGLIDPRDEIAIKKLLERMKK